MFDDSDEDWMDIEDAPAESQKDCSLAERIIEAKQRYFQENWKQKDAECTLLQNRPDEFWTANILSEEEFRALDSAGEIEGWRPHPWDSFAHRYVAATARKIMALKDD